MRYLCLLFVVYAVAAYPQDIEKPKTGGPFAVKLKQPKSQYYLYVPATYKHEKSWPLLVVLHGAGDSAKNFINAWTNYASKYRYILCAIKSSGRTWAQGDSKRILATIKDVKKRYLINEDLVFLAGYSAGAFMASQFGSRNYKLFRAIAVVAGADFRGIPSKAKDYLSIFILCGTLDQNITICRQSYQLLKAGGFDVEFKAVAGMQHSPLRVKELEWFFEKIERRIHTLEDLLKRAKRAKQEKRYLDAISACKEILAKKTDTNKKVLRKAKKQAQKCLNAIEKIGERQLKNAQRLAKTGKMQKAREMFLQISKEFAGLDVAKKALENLKKKVLMIIASKDFRDEELFEPKKMFEKAGLKVTVASSTLKEVKGMLGGSVKPQMLIKNIKVVEWDAVIFVGGLGAKEYYDDKIAHKIAKESVKHKKVLGAICIAPCILANAGVLKGKRATVWSSEKERLTEMGAKYEEKGVVVDGRIITASGPDYAKEFAKQILKVLDK